MKKALIIIGSIVGLLFLSVAGYGFYLYKSVENTVDDRMHVTIDREKSAKRDVEVDMENQDPLAFLLLGVDTREADSGRSDTMMVITANPEDNSMKMVSIPRDTRTEIVGRGTTEKINHAYAHGGPEMAMDTVENYLDIPIDYFMTVNMEGFKDIVDALGGVTVDNDFAFNQSGHSFDAGELFLNGDEALAYARMRKADSRGDLGRNDRQRQIINSIIEEGAQFSSVTKAQSLLDAMGNNIATNLNFDQMMKIQSNYRSVRHNMTTLEIDGYGERIDNIWYYIVPEEERLRVSGELQAHLGLDGAVTVKSDEEDEA
ncbi:LCP family glycopolymer transferase [Evansella halocellulosilytica]|uniref:LCP family glycopolymer transferase n=1 Tax=Evansella halocellulosilytica TaxID=2011013 RepID=UPI000BB78A6B|nr:LCP family protein [Evansella halocellulosilytica]